MSKPQYFLSSHRGDGDPGGGAGRWDGAAFTWATWGESVISCKKGLFSFLYALSPIIPPPPTPPFLFGLESKLHVNHGSAGCQRCQKAAADPKNVALGNLLKNNIFLKCDGRGLASFTPLKLSSATTQSSSLRPPRLLEKH